MRFGIKTGANEFFYLQPIELTVAEVVRLATQYPHMPIKVRNGAGWEGTIEASWLRPMIKSPQELQSITVNPDALSYLVFFPPRPDAFLADYPLAAAYVALGEAQKIHRRPTCAARHPWWNIGERPISQALCMMSYNDRFPFWLNGAALCDARLYDIYLNGIYRDKLLSQAVVAMLNATVTALQIELSGRSNLGQGALDFKVYETANLLLINPASMNNTRLQLLGEHLQNLNVSRSIFEELGFMRCQTPRCDHPEHPWEHVQPETISLDQVKQASPGRFALDAIIFDELNLDASERLTIYRETAMLVKERLVLARNL